MRLQKYQDTHGFIRSHYAYKLFPHLHKKSAYKIKMKRKAHCYGFILSAFLLSSAQLINAYVVLHLQVCATIV